MRHILMFVVMLWVMPPENCALCGDEFKDYDRIVDTKHGRAHDRCGLRKLKNAERCTVYAVKQLECKCVDRPYVKVDSVTVSADSVRFAVDAMLKKGQFATMKCKP